MFNLKSGVGRCQWVNFLSSNITSMTHLIVVFVAEKKHGPSSLTVLGRLRRFNQSEPGAAPDDPWPAGCVEGSPRTTVSIHVSRRHSSRTALCPTGLYKQPRGLFIS